MESDVKDLHTHMLETQLVPSGHLPCPCCRRKQDGSYKRARTFHGGDYDDTQLCSNSIHSQMQPLQQTINSHRQCSNVSTAHPCYKKQKHTHLSSSLQTFFSTLLVLVVFISLFDRATSHQMTPKWDLSDIKTVSEARDAPIQSGFHLKIPDLTAIAGRIFYYQIPHKHNGTIYQATEAGRPRLPWWLHLNKTTGIFTGVPLPTDSGRVYISIEAHKGKGTTRISGSVVFVLEVKGYEPSRLLHQNTKDMTVDSVTTSSPRQSSQLCTNRQLNSLSLHKCTPTEPPVLANLLFLANFSSLTSLQRTNLFMIASEFVEICPEQLFLRSLDWSDQDGALLWSQLADSDLMDYFGLATILSFQIACRDQFNTLDSSLLVRLEGFLVEAENGLLLEDEGGDVRTIAYEQWFISIDASLSLQSKSKSKTKHRIRRQIDLPIEIVEATATTLPEFSSTPLPSLPSPTSSETRFTSFTTPTLSSVLVPPTRVIPSSEISRVPSLTKSPTLPSTTSAMQPITSMTFEPVTSLPVMSLSLDRTSVIPPTVRSSIEVPTVSFSSSSIIVPSSTSEIFLFTETIVFPTPVMSSSVILLMPMSPSELTLSISIFTPSPIATPTSFIFPELTTEITFPSETFIPQSSFFVFETSLPIFQSTPIAVTETSSVVISTPAVLSSSVMITPSSSFILSTSTVILFSPSMLAPMETSELTLSISRFTPTPTPTPSISSSPAATPEVTTEIVIFPTETFIFTSTPVFESTTSILAPLTTIIATAQVVSTSIVTRSPLPSNATTVLSSTPFISTPTLTSSSTLLNTTTALFSTPFTSTPILPSSPILVNTTTALSSTPFTSTPTLPSSPILVNTTTALSSTPFTSTPTLPSSPILVNTTTALSSTPFTSTPTLPSSPIPVNITTALSSTPVFITPTPSPIPICEMINCSNGICIDLMNDFECACYLGWTGEFCETDIDFCETSPCRNRNSLACEDGNSTYTCVCVVGFTGLNCTIDIDECEPNPCLNNGTCINQLFGIFECVCPEGFTGSTCETDLAPCDPNPCPNRTTCMELGPANFTCVPIESSPTIIATSFLTTSLLINSTVVVPPSTTSLSPTMRLTTRLPSASVISFTPLPPSTIVSSSPILETTSSIQSSAIESSPIASSTPIRTTLIPTPSPTPIPNDPPVLLNAIGTILVREGQLFQFPIPEETFFDVQSGSTSNLTLTLLDSNGNSIPNTSWIQIRDNTIEGLPLKLQVEASSITDYVFILRVEDNFGSSVHDFVTVRIFPQAEIANFLAVFFEGEFELFNQNLSAKLDLVTHLAGLSPETGTDGIYVKEFRSGSIAVSYNNLTISDLLCSEFQEWVSFIYSNGQYTAEFVQALMPFNPIAAPIIEGPCNFTTTDIIPTVGGVDNIDTGNKSDLDIVLATVIPAAIIILILLVIGIIVFMAYRSRRSERSLLVTDSEERTFLHRRPVFLPGETELPSRSRRPVVLPNEIRSRGGPPLRGDQPAIRLEEVSESEYSSDDEELVTLPYVSVRTRLLPQPQDSPPPYTLPPDYVYPS